ncbi:tetratricopeptide repeat protein [Sphingobacterium sp.]|uniref:tetratricopeptide repeat protein n=1 Tax=Sphingobacterium sp. TaxID=341027 RepID=UPI00258C227B|nr:tetratricopeptide repeat protein [Sphingobacterium sp.]WET68864.1 MAG: tetratricopeptide repeat protein [Sphingobacterium sp.]
MMKSLAKKLPLLTVSLVELRKCYQVLIINLFILLAVLLSNNASAQVDLNNLRNNWIQIDVTRLDGSKILAVPHPHVKDVFQSLQIEKCFDLSKINVDALYNMVAIYNETGQTEKAIEILNQLIELGQVRAQKFLRENIANSSLECHSVEQRPMK